MYYLNHRGWNLKVKCHKESFVSYKLINKALWWNLLTVDTGDTTVRCLPGDPSYLGSRQTQSIYWIHHPSHGADVRLDTAPFVWHSDWKVSIRVRRHEGNCHYQFKIRGCFNMFVIRLSFFFFFFLNIELDKALPPHSPPTIPAAPSLSQAA